MSKTAGTTTTTSQFQNEKLKDVEDLFAIDDSFDDDGKFWDNVSSVKKSDMMGSDFKDIDDDELILLTTPKKTKLDGLLDIKLPKKLDFQEETYDDKFDDDDDELFLLTTPKKKKLKLVNNIINTELPKRINLNDSVMKEGKEEEEEEEGEEVFFSAENDDDDEVFQNMDVQEKREDPLELSSSWIFSSLSDKIKQSPTKEVQLLNQMEFENALKNNQINEIYRPMLKGSVPILLKSSSRSSNQVDTSPLWHRHETWFKVVDKSSPPLERRTKTPILNLSSSPPIPQQELLVDDNDEMEVDRNEQQQEEEEEQVMPISRIAQITSASEIARRLMQTRSGTLMSRRNISTTVQASARTRNSTIELMTQKPQLNSGFDDEFESLSKSTKNLEKNVKPVILSEEQLKVVEILKQGENIFYTGSAGTGKSILLRSLIKTLRKQHNFDCVGVTASTGLALCNIGGSTLHSFTGIGLGNGDVKSLVKKIKKSKKNLKKWRNLKVLIIDEISMIEGELLDKLNLIGKELRKNEKPFGGIQLIVCGDFYQLPPVAKDKPLQFAFECDAWKEAIKITIILKKVFRQQGDSKFIDMLNDIRGGLITSDTAYEFGCLSRALPNDDDIDATELFPTRQEVDRSNNERLNKIKEPIVQFHAFDTGSIDDHQALQKLLNNFLAPPVLNLKKGAQVMMIKNIDETLVNGSLGKVLDFIDPDTYMFYKRAVDNGEIEDNDILNHIEGSKSNDTFGKLVTSEYLGEESSIELDDNIFDFFKNIKTGSSDELLIHDIEHKKDLINALHTSSKGRRLPLVRFKLTDGNTRDVLVEPEKFEVEDPLNEHKPIASRTQIPLILAWALSIHKSQGQTLTKVKVNLHKIFEKGQAYVALSRATSRDGLQILNFNPTKIMAHPRVINFYTSLIGVDDIDLNQNKNKRERSLELSDEDHKRQRQFTGFSHQLDYLLLEDNDFSSD